MDELTDAVNQATRYGPVFLSLLVLLVVGILPVLVLNVIANRALYPHLATRGRRFAAVAFGTAYVLVLAYGGLRLLVRLGYDTSIIGPLVLSVVLGGAVLIFVLIPYLPRLPFAPGHMVEVGGSLGVIETISPMHTQLRTFDGQIVFLPNAMLMASKIVNYHSHPTRRVELVVNVTLQSDMGRSQELLLEIMKGEPRVLEDPAPTVLVTNAKATGVDLAAWCWVKNGDWLGARSDLWLRVIEAFGADDRVALSLATYEVRLSEKPTPAPPV